MDNHNGVVLYRFEVEVEFGSDCMDYDNAVKDISKRAGIVGKVIIDSIKVMTGKDNKVRSSASIVDVWRGSPHLKSDIAPIIHMGEEELPSDNKSSAEVELPDFISAEWANPSNPGNEDED